MLKQKNTTKKEQSTWQFKFKSIVATLITFVFVVILAISFGQVPGCNPGGGARLLARVAGKPIYVTDTQLRRYMQRIAEDNKNMKFEALQYNALQMRIRDALMLKAAEDNGIRISDSMLRTVLLNYLKQSGTSRNEFLAWERSRRRFLEDMLRRDYKTRILQADVTSAAKLTDIHFLLEEEMKSMQASVALVLVDLGDYLAEKKVDKASLEGFYKRNSDKYNTFYKASHILVKTKAEADKLAAQLKQNKTQFAALAAKHSQDPGSAKEGGKLGWVFSSEMIPAFSTAATALKPGQISEPVKSRFGYHLIRLDDKKQFSSVQDMNPEARKRLIRAYWNSNSSTLKAQAEKELKDRLQQLHNMVKSGKAGFAQAARNLGFQARRSGYFSFMSAPEGAAKQGPMAQLAGFAPFHIAAFSLKPGEVSQVLDMKTQNRESYLLLTVLDRKQIASPLLEYGRDKKKFEALPRARQEAIRNQQMQEMAKLKRELQGQIFYSWIMGLQQRYDVQVNWENLKRDSGG